MFTTPFYVRITTNRFRVKNLDNAKQVDHFSVIPFSHPRMLIGDFSEAEKALKAALSEVKGSKWLSTSFHVVIHPVEKIEGGLAPVEERTLQELAMAAGASHVVVWVGAELDDVKAKAKLSTR